MKMTARVRVVSASVAAGAMIAGLSAQQQRPPVPPERLPAYTATARPAPPGQVGVLPVQGNVYLLNLGDVNIVAQVGNDGILLVDSGPAEWSQKVIDTIRDRFGNRPLRYIVNTHMHDDATGGNAALATALGPVGGGGFGGGGRGGIRIIAHEKTLNRMQGTIEGEKELPQERLPTSTFFGKEKELYFNGEPIEVMYRGPGHTDGDVMVFFRGSDVIATGDLFSTASYPILDEKRGSSYQGHLDALNWVLDLTVPRFNEQGGTMVIPGHGRLCNESDVDDYRNWMTIVRDRMDEMIKAGRTLAEIKAAKITLDFDGVFANPSWTTDQFVESVYRDRSKAAGGGPRAGSN